MSTYDPTYKITLDSLPPPQIIVEPLYQDVYKSLLEEFLGIAPDYAVLLESDPAVKLIQAFAYREYLLRQRINEAARANILAFATGSDLDHLGSFYNVERLVVQAEDLTANPPLPLIMESDDRFRDRIQTRIIGWSTAGAREHYRYWAMTADPHVEDANVDTPEDGSVRVSILADNETGIPTSDLIDAVRAVVTRDDVQVLTDHLTVAAAEALVQPIEAVIRLLPSTPQAVFSSIVTDFTAAMSTRIALGRDLTRSWIIEQLHRPGVYEVILLQPAATVVATPNQFVTPGDITLTQGSRAE